MIIKTKRNIHFNFIKKNRMEEENKENTGRKVPGLVKTQRMMAQRRRTRGIT